ncbi:MAG: acyltransferase family protein [Gammaproteobacteria bacterium]
MSESRSYRPEIDGLRAIAVTSVILFHGQLAPLPGGFAGVDVFFVISGFLIAGILLNELETGRFSILRFYERRVRRIIPALVVVLAGTSALMWALADPTQLLAYAKSLAAVLLMLSNFFFGANSGYFAPALAEAPLFHTWSLAVEEQFYLAFPAALALIWRRRPERLLTILAAVALLSLALAEIGWRLKPDLGYFLPLTRAWELMVGAMAAEAVRRWRPGGHAGLAALGLTLIVLAFLFQSETTPYPAWPALLPVVGSALVLVFARADRGPGRWLATRPFVAIGLVSYSAYLWHQPLFALARIVAADSPSWSQRAGLAALTFALAAVTWVLVEQPFRRKENRWLPGAKGLVTAAAAATAALACVAALGWTTAGNDAAWRGRHPEQAAMLDLVAAAARGRGLPPDYGRCRFNLTQIDQDARSRIEACAAMHGGAAVVMGDSHAIDLFNALAMASPAPFLLGITGAGCQPAAPDAACALDGFAALAADSPQLFRDVLFAQSGTPLLDGPNRRPASRQVFRRLRAGEPVPRLAANARKLAALVAFLDGLAGHVPVTVLAPRIEPHVPPNLVLRVGCGGSYALRPGLEATFRNLDTVLAARLGGTRVRYLVLAAHDFDMTQDFMTCETLYWSDGDHWSPSGEARFGARLLPLLPEAFRPR